MQFFKAIVVVAQMLVVSSAMTAFPSRCGIQNEMIECGAENPLGACCSEFGYCGKTDAHCKPSMGCQSGCAANDMPGYTDSDRCGPANKGLKCNPNGIFGGCCSSLGFCGTGKNFCLPSNGCISGCDVEDPKYSDNERCGSANKGLLCNPNKEFGNCCSESGYCGSTEDYCLPINGCQSGCTVKSTSAASPTATASSTIASSSASSTVDASSSSSDVAPSSSSSDVAPSASSSDVAPSASSSDVASSSAISTVAPSSIVSTVAPSSSSSTADPSSASSTADSTSVGSTIASSSASM